MQKVQHNWNVRVKSVPGCGAGRRKRLQNFRVAAVVIPADQHILVENNRIIKHRLLLGGQNGMYEVRLNQKISPACAVSRRSSY